MESGSPPSLQGSLSTRFHKYDDVFVSYNGLGGGSLDAETQPLYSRSDKGRAARVGGRNQRHHALALAECRCPPSLAAPELDLSPRSSIRWKSWPHSRPLRGCLGGQAADTNRIRHLRG